MSNDITNYENMNQEKYGYTGKTENAFRHLIRNLHFTGTGKVVSISNKVKELNFEILCDGKLDLKFDIDHKTDIINFSVEDKIIHSSKYLPDDVTVHFDGALNFTESTDTTVPDH